MIASDQPLPTVCFDAFFSNLWEKIEGHGCSLAITWYAITSVHEQCDGQWHLIENGCISTDMSKEAQIISFNIAVALK